MVEIIKYSPPNHKLKILEHHARLVKNDYPGITDFEQAKEVVLTELIPHLEKSTHSDGSKRYPSIKKDKFVNNFARIIVSVNKNDYKTIPDYSEVGYMNKDIACEACGNLKDTFFTLKCELVAKRKELTLKHYYESLKTSVRFKKRYD